jgi:hypothetical protein
MIQEASVYFATRPDAIWEVELAIKPTGGGGGLTTPEAIDAAREELLRVASTVIIP